MGQPAPPPPQQLGGLGSAVSSQAGSGAEGFLALCAARLPLSPCVDLLVYTCSCVCDWGEYMAFSPHRELMVHVPRVPPVPTFAVLLSFQINIIIPRPVRVEAFSDAFL